MGTYEHELWGSNGVKCSSSSLPAPISCSSINGSDGSAATSNSRSFYSSSSQRNCFSSTGASSRPTTSTPKHSDRTSAIRSSSPSINTRSRSHSCNPSNSPSSSSSSSRKRRRESLEKCCSTNDTSDHLLLTLPTNSPERNSNQNNSSSSTAFLNSTDTDHDCSTSSSKSNCNGSSRRSSTVISSSPTSGISPSSMGNNATRSTQRQTQRQGLDNACSRAQAAVATASHPRGRIAQSEGETANAAATAVARPSSHEECVPAAGPGALGARAASSASAEAMARAAAAGGSRVRESGGLALAKPKEDDLPEAAAPGEDEEENQEAESMQKDKQQIQQQGLGVGSRHCGVGIASSKNCSSRKGDGREEKQQRHRSKGEAADLEKRGKRRAVESAASTYPQRVCCYSLRNPVRGPAAAAASLRRTAKRPPPSLMRGVAQCAAAAAVRAAPVTQAVAARLPAAGAAGTARATAKSAAVAARGGLSSSSSRRAHRSRSQSDARSSRSRSRSKGRRGNSSSKRRTVSPSDACSSSKRKLTGDPSTQRNRRRRRSNRDTLTPHNSSNHCDNNSRRVNPRRACRSGGPVPCGLEWTRRLVAAAKEKAAVVSWSARDSPSLRKLLKIRREPQEFVGLGLYLQEPLRTCCCSIWKGLQQQHGDSPTQQQPSARAARGSSAAAAGWDSAAPGRNSVAAAAASGGARRAAGDGDGINGTGRAAAAIAADGAERTAEMAAAGERKRRHRTKVDDSGGVAEVQQENSSSNSNCNKWKNNSDMRRGGSFEENCATRMKKEPLLLEEPACKFVFSPLSSEAAPAARRLEAVACEGCGREEEAAVEEAGREAGAGKEKYAYTSINEGSKEDRKCRNGGEIAEQATDKRSGCSTVRSRSSSNNWALKSVRCSRSSSRSNSNSNQSSRKGCGCSEETGGFRVLCFRGDVVLSPHNDRSTAPLLSTEEKRLVYDPEENPGIEPASHLSPAFTLSSLEIPFSFQLQAHRYLLGEQEEEVKAIYANHYCAKHCSAFFDINASGTPCIVTRPGAEIAAGPFGVFYGWSRSSSFPCAREGCEHVCEPRCSACFSMEMQWRKCWRMHRRFAVPEDAAASVGGRERDVAAAKTEEEAAWRGGHGKRRVVMKQQGQQQMMLWGEQQIVPPLCFSDEEEKKRKDEEAGAATKSRRTGKAVESALPEEKKAGQKRQQQQQSFCISRQQQQQTQQQLQQELPYTKQLPGRESPDTTTRDEKSEGYSTPAAGSACELQHQTNVTFPGTAAGRTTKAAQKKQEDFQAAEEEMLLATAAATETEEAAGEKRSFVRRCAKGEPTAEEAALPAAQQRPEASTAADVRGLRVLPAAASIVLANAAAPAEKGRTREKDQWEKEPREEQREECSLKARSCCCAPLCSLRRKSCTYCTLGPPRRRNSCSLQHTQRDSSSVDVDGAAAADVRDQKTAAATGEAVCNGSGVLNRWGTKRTWDEEEEEEDNSSKGRPEQLLLHAANVSGWRDRVDGTENEWHVEALPPGTAATVAPRRTVAPVSADAVSLSGKADVVTAGTPAAAVEATAAAREATAAAGEAAREGRRAAGEAVSIAHVEGGRDDKVVDYKGRTEAGQQRNGNSSWNKQTGGEDSELHKAVQRKWTEQDEKSSNSSNFRDFAVEPLAAGSKRSAVKSNHRAGADVVAAVCAAVAVLRAAAAAAEEETPSVGDEESERLLKEGVSGDKSEAIETQEKNIGTRAADVVAVVEAKASTGKGDEECHQLWSRKRVRSFLDGEGEDGGTGAAAQSHALRFWSPKRAASRPPAEPAAMAAPGKRVAADAIKTCRLGEQLLAQDIPSRSEAPAVSSATAARAAVARRTAGAAMCSAGRRCCAPSPWWLLPDQSLLTQQAEQQEQQQLDSAAAAALHAPAATCRVHAQQQRQPLDGTGTTARPKGNGHCECVLSAPHREGDVALIQAATLLDADPACGPAFAALAAVVPLASPAYLRPLPPLLPRRGTSAEEACTNKSGGSSSLPRCGCYCREERNSSWTSSLSCWSSCGCSSSTGGRNVSVCGRPGVAALVSKQLHTASSTGAKAVETAYEPPPQQQQGGVPAVTKAPREDGNDERLSTATLLVDEATRLLLSLGAAARAERCNDGSNSRETPFPRW